jgi:hypothetical protein
MDVEGMRSQASALAAAGRRVFPLLEGTKLPAIDGWPDQASSDPERVKRFWSDPVSGEAQHWNIGVATGRGLVVIDIDDKDGKDGSASLAYLEDLHGELPPTLTVRTPSGGRHLYFRLPPGVWAGTNSGKLGQGIDVRAEGGYVAGPGSINGAGGYVVIYPLPIADAPAWLVEKLRGVKPAERIATAAPEDLDQPADVERAINWLQRHAPPSGSYAVAARLNEFGLYPETAAALMVEHWNPRRHEPRDHDHFLTRAEHARDYAQKPPGAASAALEFDDVSAEPIAQAAPDVENSATKRPKLYAVPFGQSADMALATYAEPLVEGLLDQGAMCVAYGDSNAGKTFVMLHMGYCIAAGVPFAERAVQQGAVAYVAAEGGRNIHRRVAALRKHYGAHDDVPFVVIPCAVDLLNPEGDTEALIRLLRREEKRMGQPFALIVIDTLHRALAGGDENASTAMGAIVTHADRIRTAMKATLAFVHHSGKDKAKGARGHSSLRAATDTEIEVEPGVMTVTKQRDMDIGPALRFRLMDVPLGATSAGRPVKSAISLWYGAGDMEPAPLTPSEQRVLDAIRAVSDAQIGSEEPNSKNVRVSSKMILEFLDGQKSSSSRLSSTGLANACSSLVEKGHVLKSERGQWVMGEFIEFIKAP